MKNFIEKLNQETDHRYSYLKLKDVNVSVERKQIELILLYPETLGEVPKDDQAAVIAAAERIFNANARLSVRFVKSHYDPSFFVTELLKFFQAFPAISATVEPADIVSSPGVARVALAPVIYDYCAERGIAAEVTQFLARTYYDPIDFSFVKKEGAETDFLAETDDAAETTELELPGGRFITPQNVDALVGKPIYERALYIQDAVRPRPSLTVCGTLTEFSEFSYRAKDGSGKEKKFYRLHIEDYTGMIQCLYFPNKYTQDKIGLLKKGKQLIVRGSLEPDRKNEGALVYILKDISYCTLPTEFTLNRYRRKIDAQYRSAQPEAYTEHTQASLFDAPHTPAVTASLRDKTYVVFDLETTGFNAASDRIVEIGAVKIENGRFTETFSALINPGMPIPQSAIDVHGITDRDVAGKPLIDAVLPDFYKFVQGAVLVAHNIQFDLSFLQSHGIPLGIYFEQPCADTLALARKAFPGMMNYKLVTLTKAFAIEHAQAHRAVSDAVATAKLLVKIFEKLDA